MKETLSSISKRTGLSITTISRVLNGKAEKYRISKETAEIVKKEAKRCNYRPIHVAQNLRTGKHKTIGLLIPSLTNPYFADIAAAIISEAHKRNYSTIVMNTMEDEQMLRKCISLLVEKKISGMIVAPCGDDPMWLEQVDKSLLPVVLIDRFYDNTSLSYVTTNNYQGGIRATSYLTSHGHRNIVCIQGVPSSMPNIERIAGYKKSMADIGAESEIRIVGNAFTTQNGYTSMKHIIESTSPIPTAIFALSNTIMLGALKAIKESRLRVPEDISIISFDNYSYLDYMEPPISRISQPIEDMCALATSVLDEKINKIRVGDTQMRLSPTLVEGKSVLRKNV